MDFRRLTTVEDMKQVVTLQIAAWGLEPEEAMPHHFFIAANKIGGLVVGAFDGERLIGFTYTLPSLLLKGGQVMQEWDMLAVLPPYQNQGIAIQLIEYYLQELPAHCREFGLAPTLSYTFDPFLVKNVHLFVHRLGTLAASFFPNHYGEMTGINAGMRTDRLRGIWNPFSDHAQARMKKSPSPLDVPYQPEDRWIGTLVYQDGLPHIEMLRLDHTGEVLFLPVPTDFDALKTENMTLVREWQERLAGVFAHYLGHGWVITDFIRPDTPEHPGYVYVFRRDIDSIYTTIASEWPDPR